MISLPVSKKILAIRKISSGWDLIISKDLRGGDIFRVIFLPERFFEAVTDPYVFDGELRIRFKEIDPKSLTFDEPDGKYTLALSFDEVEFLSRIAIRPVS